MKTKLTGISILGLALAAVFVVAAGAQEILPFPPTPSASTAGLTMQDSIYKKRVEPKRLAAGTPNILIILMDDLGPGTPSTYGGEVHTPTLDRVAKMGISFNRFHSTAMCSPTRAALLTGRNHTRVCNGQISAIANDFDGFSGTIPKSSATVAEVLKDYGYNTGAWGKWHNTPEEQITSKGPFDYWPTGYGFEYFYGFLAGEASQYEPTLVRNTTQVTEEKPKGYHLTEDIADRRHQVAAGAAGLRARETVLHVLGAGRMRMARTRSSRSGRTSTRASLTTAGTSIASGLSPAPRPWAGFRRTPNSRRGRHRWRRGIRSRRPKNPSSAA